MADNAGDPDALQREIERTRDELARTIDALTDRLQPKNVARRGVDRAKANATEVRRQAEEKLPRSAWASGGRHRGAAGGEETPGSQDVDAERTTTYITRRVMRPEGIAVAVGFCLLLAAGVVVWRRRSR